jgi:4-hydroxy-tetrahydrodipicolinate synthase
VNGKAQVIAGAGSNSTAEAIRLTKHARDAGADAALIVAPYYNRPTQEGLYRHFASIAEAIDIPIVIYNIPGRSGVNITDETLARLAKIPNIAGLKDATGDLARVSALRLLAGERFEQLSGEDMTAPAFNALGGVGCISVTSNIAPKLCAEQQALTLAGDYQSALRLQDRLAPLHQAMFCETSPAPVKYAASRLGFCSPALRPPLLEASQEAQARVQKAMRQAGLL